MKLVYVDQWFGSGQINGPTRHIGYLSRELARRGHEVTILTGYQSDRPKPRQLEYNHGEIKIVQLKILGKAFMSSMPGLLTSIKKEAPDVLHVQGYRNFFSDISAVASLLNRIPLVLTPRGSILGYQHRPNGHVQIPSRMFYDALTMRLSLRAANAVVASSRLEYEEGRRFGVPSSKMRLIPHGMEFPALPQRMTDLEGEPRILLVSRITPHRNITDTIEAFKLVLAEFPAAVFYIAGEALPSSYDMLEAKYALKVYQLARDKSLRGRVRLLGGIYDSRLWELYSSCDLFVYASEYDNFAFALLEAAYFGLPIVTTDVGIASDLVNGQGGIILSGHEPDTIAAGILKMLKSDGMTKNSVAEHLRKRALLYSIEKNADAHLALYEDIATRRA